MHWYGQWPMKIYGQIQNKHKRDFTFEQNMSFCFTAQKWLKMQSKRQQKNFFFKFCGDLCVTKVGETRRLPIASIGKPD